MEIREKQKAELIQTTETDKLFIRARQYAKGNTKEAIDKFLDSINRAMDSKIQEATNKDAQKISEKLAAYQQYLSETDSRLYNEIKKLWDENESEYQRLLQEFNNANTEIKFISLQTDFQRLGEYKDSKILAQRCWSEYLKLQKQFLQEQERQINNKNKEEAQKKEKKFKLSIFLIVVVLLGIIVWLIITSK